MGRLILVSGANSSGKSALAEQLTVRAGERRYYLATMIPETDENRRRIEKHVRRRAGLNFRTIECPYRVSDSGIPAGASVLLEDVSNLLSNVMFEKDGDRKSVLSDICTLREQCGTLVAVTISGLKSDSYEGGTAAYIAALNTLNEELSRLADVDIRMEAGKPIFRKGAPDYAD